MVRAQISNIVVVNWTHDAQQSENRVNLVEAQLNLRGTNEARVKCAVLAEATYQCCH